MHRNFKFGISRVAALTAAYYVFIKPQINTKTEFHYIQTPFNKNLVSQFDVLREYRPPFLYAGPFAQSIWQSKYNDDTERIKVIYKRHLVFLEDGGSVS